MACVSFVTVFIVGLERAGFLTLAPDRDANPSLFYWRE